MKPEAIPLKIAKKNELDLLLTRLRDVKKAEFLVGGHIPREEASKIYGSRVFKTCRRNI